MSCKRSGMCCQVLYIRVSPRQLRDAYRKWKKGDGSDYAEIDILFPMLEGRALGKRITADGPRYYYGPCKMLGTMPDGKPGCTIQADKPAMCSGYPFYELTPLERPANPAIFRGCGFNTDPDAGVTLSEVGSGLLPLEENER